MTSRALLAALLGALTIVLFAGTAAAHKPGLSRLLVTRDAQALGMQLTFARDELLAIEPTLDADHSGTLDGAELVRSREPVERAVIGRVLVAEGGVACVGELLSLTNEENDGVTLHARYECSATSPDVTVTVALFEELSAGHRCLAEASGEEAVLSRDHPTARFHPSLSAEGAPPPKQELGSFGRIVLLGVEHILTGWDHLLFLFGLVLVGGSFRATLAVITAFTLAHSITLAMAALGVWAPSPAVVEPAIALSIAYVGVENFVVSDIRKRWRITFPFGLVHGFGFAGALAEVRIPHERLVTTLVGFNLGVEMGQIGVLLLVVPLLALLRRRAWFRGRGVRVLSAVIVVVGVALFVQRLREG